MEPQQNSNKNLIIKIIAAIIVLAVAGFAFSRMDNTSDETANQNTNGAPTEEMPGGDTEPVATNRKYRDGTYTSTGRYTSPAGQEEVQITLVIKDDAVSSGTFVGKAVNPGSVKNQTLFKEGFDQYVVGKNVDDLQLEVVNGSSLTPKGFMDALSKIKVEAAA